jgi:YidC/Oxa1 family membrane protein insertase
MNFRTALILTVGGFVIFCGWLVVESGLFENGRRGKTACILLQNTTGTTTSEPNVPVLMAAEPQPAKTVTFSTDSAPAKVITLGSTDKKSGFKFQLELSSKGAAVRSAIFSEFDDRDYKNPQPLVILSPVQFADGSEIMSLANAGFVFVKQELQLPLWKLSWKSGEVITAQNGSQSASFEAVIRDSEGKDAAKLTKAYKVFPGRYDFECALTVENLSAEEQKVRFDLTGPVGISKESARDDMKRVVGGFRDSQGAVVSTSLDVKMLEKAKSVEDRRLVKTGANFLWAAITNKYFSAILVSLPDQGKEICDWVTDRMGMAYNPDGDVRGSSGDETVGVDFKIASNTYSPAGQAGSSKVYNFRMYLGPKDKRLFDKNEYYRSLGFIQTITFMPCFCCPAQIIYPLAFGILASMEWMYRFIPNYGIVIIILVFLIRLVMHPLTKKSQVSMSKMSKLGPQVEELKKKYGDNKAELNKRTMALYKEQGASPIIGFLPMLVQMPIWIALYSAIYASVALRGAAFLPVWITDLAAPDALIRFPAVTLPLFGTLDAFNLLPILMGVAFYLQQKLTPTQASPDPQVAQQQKIMMIMMPVMFPLMLYKAPSGLNLYIMASTFAGVIEQYVIKKHIQEKEQAESLGLVDVTSKTGGKVKKKKPKPFFRF